MGKFYFITAGILFFVIASCKNGSSEKKLTDAEIAIRDSISKVEQRKKVDSLKKKNPLLIMPPDSNYTGDYTDKYPGGIIKFKGFFRFGKRHGQWMSFYPTGLLWSEMHYDKGLRHGPNIAYYEGGGKRYEGVYKNDERDSVWCYYDSIGNVAEKVLFKHDKIVQKLPLK
ncbi:MAG: toxin-antitoxin system YwqK family antitoxin [Bacteroidia bacterium]